MFIVVFEFCSNFMLVEYMEVVCWGKEYVYVGDIFQFVFLQCFSVELGDLYFFVFYCVLWWVNFSFYFGYLVLGEVILVVSSFESLLCSDGVSVVICLIVGICKCGVIEVEDDVFVVELFVDEKECVEYLMLVDFGCNDIGKVSVYGIVKVENVFFIECYSYVMYIVLGVCGELWEGQMLLYVFVLVLLMGMVSGVFKIWVMEIIDEFEFVCWGLYGGCFGYVVFDGSFDMVFILWMMVIVNGKVYIQVGVGVVVDSVFELEEQEMCNKVVVLMWVVELVVGGL